MTEVEDSSNNLQPLTIDDEFTREKKYINSCGFSDEALRRRDKDVIELQKIYPNTCVSWLELAWNYTEMTPKEEQDRIIASKEWEKPSTNSKRNTGGVIKNAIKVQTQEELDVELAEIAELKKLEDLEVNKD